MNFISKKMFDRMIAPSILHRLLKLGVLNNSVSSQLNVLLKKWDYCGEHKKFHVSSINCSNKQPNVNEKGADKMVKVWLNMTVKELAEALKTDTNTIKSLIPNEDLKYGSASIINDREIMRVAKLFGKKCMIVKNPKAIDTETKTVKSQQKTSHSYYQPPPKPENLVKRPPVVTVMGHVDHGKTTLLDSLRNTSVVKTEFGGITQHIGAFSVEVKPGQKITFIDTPGHAAFTAMRARGAQVTDIVVLVIAADDGVMEQTVESIRIARKAGVHIIVALNKIDKPTALSTDVIKEKLLLEGIQVEDKGGDVQLVAISALKKINLDVLTEQILLEAELMNLKGDPTGLIEGVVIESKVDLHKGVVATIIVKRGTLRRGKVLVAGKAMGKVRAMLDENGNQYSFALPSTPVQVLGWKTLPYAGDEVTEAKSEKEASIITKAREKMELEAKAKTELPIIQKMQESLRTSHKEMQEHLKTLSHREIRKLHNEMKRKTVQDESGLPKIKLILKGDVHGSLDALLDILNTYDKNDECELSIVDYSVGNVSLNDIENAEAFNAIIYAFNVQIHQNAKDLATEKKTDIRYFNVIYKLLDDLVAELNSSLPPKEEEEIIGEAKVNENFLIKDKKNKIPVAGCTCVSGELKKNLLFKIIRKDKEIYRGKAVSMRHHKNEVNSIQKNVDCGLMFESFQDVFEPGDQIICFQMIQVPQKTGWKPGF